MSKRTRLLLLTIALLLPAGLVTGCSSTLEQDPGALTANTWSVVKYADASGRLVEPTEPAALGLAAPSMAFDTRGKLSGFGGVNTYGASYEADTDGSIEIGNVISTKMAGPPELMNMEDAFFTALAESAFYRVENGGLTLLNSDEEPVIRARPERKLPLEGTEWSCTGFNNGNEAFVGVLADAPISALFQDGTLTGFSGVNDYMAGYDVEGDEMDIQSPTTTTVDSGQPEAMEQESAYLGILSDVTAYRIEANELTLYGAGGTRLVTYVGTP